MHILLRIQDTDDEIKRWQSTLSGLLPQVIWHAEPQVPTDIAEQIEIAVVANPQVGALRGFPRLAFVQSLWAGVDSVLADTGLPESLVIARMVDPAMQLAMAETTLWATLSLHRGFFDYASQQVQSHWHELPQRAADDVRVTVLGLGAMGLASAQRLAEQGYRVTAWRAGHRSRPLTSQHSNLRIETGPQQLHRVLADSEIVINLLPLTDETRGLLNREFFAALPAGASIVNLARGGHLNESDLLSALDSGHLRRAVLDVFQTEPLPSQHPFWRHPRVTVLPHVAAMTDPRSAAKVVAQQVNDWCAGRAVANCVERSRGY